MERELTPLTEGWQREIDDAELRRANFEEEVRARQAALRARDITASTGNDIDDIVLALHGVDAVKNPAIALKWHELAGRFDGKESQPYLVINRYVFDDGAPHVQPDYWLAVVPQQPIVYHGKSKVTLQSTGASISASPWWPDHSYGPVVIRPGGFTRVVDKYHGDLVSTGLDRRLSQYVSSRPGEFFGVKRIHSDEAPYSHYEDKDRDLSKLSRLEVVVGVAEIDKWLSAHPIKGERRVVRGMLKVLPPVPGSH